MTTRRMKRTVVAVLIGLLALVGCSKSDAETKANTKAEGDRAVIDQKVKNIDGGEVSLKDYRGKAMLIVNVASNCGYTPQYKGLQSLHEKYKDKGLVVMGFPSNDFGGQEPGTESEIKNFCESRFDVSFPMFSKVKVKGDAKADLYKTLTAETGGDEVKWNFTKFLVGKDGRVIKRFASGVEPESDELVAAVEAALAK